MHTHDRERVTFIKGIFSAAIKDISKCTLNHAKTELLQSFQQSLVYNLHVVFRVFLFAKKSSSSKLGPLLQILLPPQEDRIVDFYDQSTLEIEEAEFNNQRSNAMNRWEKWSNENEILDNDEKLISYMNYVRLKKKAKHMIHKRQLSIPGSSNTSLLTLAKAFFDSGKHYLMFNS